MKNIFLAIVTLSCSALQAQYYYNDIIGTFETNRQMQTYLANKVKTVTATGIDPNGIRRTDFTEMQEVKENGLGLKITTRNNSNSTIFYKQFDSQGRLISITDSTTDIQSITKYEYNADGRIILVQNTVKDATNDINQTEIHQWIYNPSGMPAVMWRIINKTDSLEIRFTPDENGNTGDERTFRKGVETGVAYYYYDDKKRLTDIVRYNTKAKRLLPDIMFEYDENDRAIQKITTISGLSLSYLIWRYQFDERGLKIREALFNHDKELTGKIEYKYSFGQ